MFSVNQLNVFFVCVLAGVFAALLRDLLSGSLAPMRGDQYEGRAWLVYELVFFASFGVAFTALSAMMKFPPLRGYMLVGLSVGFLLYYKTLRIIVAFLKKVCYNIVNKILRKRKNSEKQEVKHL